MKIKIIKNNQGWYNFQNVPQEHRYIKIHWLKCDTDRKALNQAKKINNNFNYEIE